MIKHVFLKNLTGCSLVHMRMRRCSFSLTLTISSAHAPLLLIPSYPDNFSCPSAGAPPLKGQCNENFVLTETVGFRLGPTDMPEPLLTSVQCALSL